MANKKEFLVSFTKEGSNVPQSVTIMAVNVVGAIDGMTKAAGVHSTNSITGFEILEKIEKGQWRRAAVKMTDKERMDLHKKRNTTPVSVPPPPPEKEEEEITLAEGEFSENQYEPYTLVNESDLQQAA